MAYLTSFLFFLIIAMTSSMAQVVNMGANDIVYGINPEEETNQDSSMDRIQLNQQQPLNQQQQLNLQQLFSQQQPAQPTQQQPIGPPTGSARLTSQSREVIICVQSCLSTQENNPVCGTDNVQYNNERRLECTNGCGRRLDPNWQEIQVLRPGACSPGSRVA